MKNLLLATLVFLASASHAKNSDLQKVPAEKAVPYAVVESSVPLTAAGRMYPAKAAEDEVEGVAVVVCNVSSAGKLASCACFQETPEGFGFCSSTVRLAQMQVKVDLQRYGLKDGDKVAFRREWRLS